MILMSVTLLTACDSYGFSVLGESVFKIGTMLSLKSDIAWINQAESTSEINAWFLSIKCTPSFYYCWSSFSKVYPSKIPGT